MTAAPGYGNAPQRIGFFTDTTVCIGCKACEVACKEWNDIPSDTGWLTGNSYDNTGGLGADTWRHVAFIEQRVPEISALGVAGALTGEGGGAAPLSGAAGSPASPVDGAIDVTRARADGFAVGIDDDAVGLGSGPQDAARQPELRWLMSSDVCKHCTTAACLDVCPTGSLFKTEFDTVVVQPDICNGCGYCVPACPYGVLDRREDDGRVWKCTLCYDRLRGGLEPACAKACPTDSINVGPLDDMIMMAHDRLDAVVASGQPGAQLYGDGPSKGVDGAGSLFLLLDDPEVYGLPPDPVAATKHLRSMWGAAAAAAGSLAVGVAAAVLGGRR